MQPMVAVFCGGQSAEHDVSLASAKSIAASLRESGFPTLIIAVDRAGDQRILPEYVLNQTALDQPIDVSQSNEIVFLARHRDQVEVRAMSTGKVIEKIDVAFPIIHGPTGEDGVIQGYFRFLGLPFVGPSILASAAAMDKDVTKRLLKEAGLPIGKFAVVHRDHRAAMKYSAIAELLGVPFFLKPANMGSSIGVHKVKSEAEFNTSLNDAFMYDFKVILEETIVGREIECAVFGRGENLIASPIGEIVPKHEFYSYEAKYLDEKGAELIMPANLQPQTVERVQDLAKKVFRVLGCEGLARIDFFLEMDGKTEGKILVNEANTLPGFTRISQYPKLMALAGVSYKQLVRGLVEHAIERARDEKALRVDR